MNSIINALLFVVSILALVALVIALNLSLKRLSFENMNLPAFESSADSQNVLENKISGWVSDLSPKNIPTSFSYPSSELFISLDFSQAHKTDILVIKNLDSYKFFCLNEILKSNNIQFAYKKVGNTIQLEVALNDQRTRQKLLSELKKYNISFSIT